MIIKLRSNLTGGIAGVLLATAVLIMIPFTIKLSSSDAEVLVNQRVLPQFTAILILIMGVILIIQSTIFHRDNIVEIKLKDEARTLLYFAVVALAVVAMKFVGYLPTAIFIVIFSFAFFRSTNWKYYIGSVGFAGVVYICFKVILKIPLP